MISMHFLPGSLKAWADKLAPSDFKFLHDQDLQRKQIFPYDYFEGSSQQICDKLGEVNMNQIELKYFGNADCAAWAERMFTEKGCKNLNDYMLMYLCVDVLLLAEVFEKFIATSFERYGLDPSWYYTTPGYSWDCAFYKTGEKIELLKDPEMIERCNRRLYLTPKRVGWSLFHWLEGSEIVDLPCMRESVREGSEKWLQTVAVPKVLEALEREDAFGWFLRRSVVELMKRDGWGME